MSDWLGLAGRVCVVTGAGSGIGAAIASEFAANGAKTVLLDKNVDAATRHAETLRQQGLQALALEVDTSNELAIHHAAKKSLATLGPADVLVNNAGFLRAGPLQEVSIADWNAVLAVNLTGYLLCSQAFGAQMRSQGSGSIVHVASISASNPQTNSGAYSASKAGVLLLSRQLAAEWGPAGIRSNAVCPGMIRTSLSAKFYEEPGFEEKRSRVTASRRIGEPIDIANTVLFLASARSSYMNGAEVLVDGGLNCMLMDMVPRPGFNKT